jgi:hypothetical protein
VGFARGLFGASFPSSRHDFLPEEFALSLTSVRPNTSNRRFRILAGMALALTLAVAGTVAQPAESASAARSFTHAPTPKIVGSILVGSRLKATRGTWTPSGATFTYQWRANGAKISGATKSLFTVTGTQVGKALSVTVSGHKSGYRTVSRTSARSVVVPVAQFPASPVPTIGGNVAYGSTLTVTSGSWGVSGVHLSYQWKSGPDIIGGATGLTYIVEKADIGKALTVVVTATKLGYTTVVNVSAATGSVPTPPVTATAATRTQRMSQSNLNSTQIGWYEQGSVLSLVCYQRGQSVKGYFSSSFSNGGWDNLWYRINDGSYAADVDLETGTLDPVVPACADQPVADTSNATVMATTQRMSSDTLNSTQNGNYGVGARLTLTCYAHGEAVKGYFSGSFPNGYDDLWYQVNDGFWVADVDIQTGSNDPVTPSCAPISTPPVSSDELTRAKSWLDAHVPYDQGHSYPNQYGSYRMDCSGFVSMAFGLPSSYTTVTLPQVVHRINKDDLQPGDIMLNTASGDNGHTGIFIRWTDALHTHYVSWEENPGLGGAGEQTVPYPYWPSWAGTSNYFPYRRN